MAPPKLGPEKGRALRSLGALSAVGLSFVMAVVIGTALGDVLDRWVGTSPWVFLLGFFFGLAARVRTGVRTVAAAARAGAGGDRARRVRTRPRARRDDRVRMLCRRGAGARPRGTARSAGGAGGRRTGRCELSRDQECSGWRHDDPRTAGGAREVCHKACYTGR